jgi:thioredoxin-like negative regulator of GroEL
VESLAEQLAGAGWTLVEFWAPDNLFCRLMAPLRVGLAASHAHRLRLICCTLDNCDGAGAAFGAVAIPALILYRNGRRVRRWLGATDLSLLRYSINMLTVARLADPVR